jgi:uncharacterized membrane protein
MKLKKIMIGVVAFIAMSSVFSQETFGIGQTTDPIIISDALRGQTFQKEVIVINTEKEPATVEIVADGDIADWTKFFRKTDLSAPIASIDLDQGERINLFAEITIPNDVKNGKYSGFISAIKKPKSQENSSDSSSSVNQKIDRVVEIEVKDEENISIRVSVIPESYDIDEKASLKVRFIYDNIGNVAVKPDINFKIKKDDKSIFNIAYPYPENLESVKPKAIFEIPEIEVPTVTLEKGDYAAEIDFAVDGDIVSSEQFRFSIGKIIDEKSGINRNKVTIIKGSLNKIWIALALAGSLIFAAAIYYFLRPRNKKSKK